jgi:hypothetical protein
MRCRKCNHIYKPAKKNRSCPQCGYELPSDKARRLAQASVRRVKIENRIAIAVLIACPVIGIAALVTGQLLILGGLLAVVVGLYLTFFGVFGYFGNLSNGGLARGLCIGFGLPVLAGGIVSWIWALNGGPVPPFPPPYLRARERPLSIRDFEPFVPFVIMAGVVGVSFLIDRGLFKLEVGRRRQSQELGQVFALPRMATVVCITSLLVVVPMCLILTIAGFDEARTGVEPHLGPALFLTLSPVTLFAYVMLRHSYGHVVLADDAVILRRLGSREKCMAYGNIANVKDSLGLVLRGCDGTLRIPRNVQGRPQLYQAILQRSQIHRDEPLPSFPYRLAVTRWAKWFGVIGTLILLGVWLGVGVGLWTALVLNASSPEAASSNKVVALLMFGLAGLIFIPATIAFVVGSFQVKQPIELIFTANEVRFRLPFKAWQAWPASDLERIYLEPVQAHLRHGSRITLYVLVLQFANGPPLRIGLDRARQFSSSPERLHGILSRLYCLDA